MVAHRILFPCGPHSFIFWIQSRNCFFKRGFTKYYNEHLSERRLAMNSELRNIADNIIDAAIKAVLPDAAVKRALDGKEFKGKVIKEENFKALTLEQQKEMFLTMLDLNQMYVQYSEMTDSKYGIDKVFQELTNKFYSDK